MSPEKQYKKKSYEDEEDFNKEQNRYMRNQGRSILPSAGMEEKPSEKRNNYFGEPRRRLEPSPEKKITREGQLISHIRSKYAN